MQQVAAEKHFRTNMKTAMDARGVSQRALAKKMRTSHPYVNRVLSGEHTPAIDQCEKISNALGYELRDMLLEPKIFCEAVLTTIP